jgi:hypothetical protein
MVESRIPFLEAFAKNAEKLRAIFVLVSANLRGWAN